MSSKPVRSKQGFSGVFPSQDTGEVGFFNGNSRIFEHDHVHVQPQARTRQASMRPPSKVRRNTVNNLWEMELIKNTSIQRPLLSQVPLHKHVINRDRSRPIDR